MSSISNVEKVKFEALLGMGGGVVLDFSNNSFASFIRDSTGLNVYDDKYAYKGNSKANRLRALWEKEPDEAVGKLLSEFLECWLTQDLSNGSVAPPGHRQLLIECRRVVSRLRSKSTSDSTTEEQFLRKDFEGVSLKALKFDVTIGEILEQRLNEMKKCLGAQAPLAVIFLAGSTLEGILLCIASGDTKRFSQAGSSPKDRSGKVLPLHQWSLKNFLDTAHEIGLLGLDVMKFSHALRDFRNFIHPYQQMQSKFNPDEHTARICWQVLMAAIADLKKGAA